MFADLAMKELTSLPDAVRAVERGRKHGQPTEAVLNRMLERRPLCCTIGPKRLYIVYARVAAHVGWPVATCAICSEAGHGQPFRKVPPDPVRKTTAEVHEHVCIGCVVGKDIHPNRPQTGE